MVPGSRLAGAPVERLPLDPSSPWWGEHRSRYRFACEHLGAGLVLDIASGSGYGVEMLAEGGRLIVGCDASVSAAAEARRLVDRTNVHFVPSDGLQLPFAGGTFDAVVSFETVEHLADAKCFIRELRRVLKDSGILLLSTPNAAITRNYPANPFHIREFTAPELYALLAGSFGQVEIRGQILRRPRRVAPFLPGYDRPIIPLDRARLVAWKLARRLPARLRDGLTRLTLGRNFYPDETDFEFMAGHATAHVLLAICYP
jgi:SAM-dependent methyltransferase